MNPVLINKADEDNDPEIFRLEDLETMFVSLVDRGANRQSKFFVVKTDDTHSVAPEIDATPEDQEILTEEKNGEGEGSEITPQDGVDAEGKSKSDLDSWLEDAGTRADDMLVDLTLELESAANPSGDATKSGAGENNALVIGDRRTAPSEDRSMDAAAQLEQDLQKARDEAKAKAIEADRLKKELDRRDRDLKKERSRVAALKSTIGAATALPTGEMLADAGSDEPPSWAGDLAEEDEAE